MYYIVKDFQTDTMNLSMTFSLRAIFLLLSIASKQDAFAFLQNSHYCQFTMTASSSIRSIQSSSKRTDLSALSPEQMRVAEIKAELKELRVGFADCFDKESLVDKLVWARNNPRPKPPPPAAPPRSQPPSQQRAPPNPSVDFGAESDMNSDIDMDVFAAAGWDAEPKFEGTGPVDHDRSPGLNRNFDQIPTDDFKKPYYG